MNTQTHPTILKHAVRWAVAATVAALVPAAYGQSTTDMANVGITPVANTATPNGIVQSGVDSDGKLMMATNKTAVLTTRDKATRVSTGSPDVADVTTVGANTILVTAKKPGSTQVVIWDEKEQSQSIDVTVSLDITALREQIKTTFPDADIKVDVVNGQITLRGRVASLKVADQVTKLASAYTKDVLNFLEISGGQQVVLNVQFIEVSRAASNQLGFSSTFTDGGSTFGSIQGPNGSPIGALAGGTEGTIGSGVTLFGGGNIGGTRFEVFLQALKQNNLARTLAEPSLVSLSGEDADFLAGGEIPIPVPQAGVGGASTITIEYKEFGVRLKYNAVVMGNGRIRLKMEPEVSSLDYNNSTSIGGQSVPGIRTRKVKNVVEMNEGQTLALAGLLQRDVNSKTSATPGLGDLPIVGAFFRNVQYTRTETELVVLVTPHLASAMNPDQVPAMPGDHWRYPNEAQLYGLADLGDDKDARQPLASRRGPAPRFMGAYGFDEKTPVIQPTTAPADSK